MSFELSFVDSVSATPTTRLLLHSERGPLTVMVDGTRFGMPELRRARSSTLLTDGDNISASAYGNRVIQLRLQLPTDKDDAASWFQKILREVNREMNVLRYRAGTTDPVFFATFRSEVSAVDWDGVSSFCVVAVEAKPFAIGVKETLSTVTVYNDPVQGSTINLNPYFETDVSDWGFSGGTFVRSTAQFHEGTASGLLTPDGVSALVNVDSLSRAAVVGTRYGASAWVRCAATRNVDVRIAWRTAADAAISESTQTVAVTANTWTFVHVDGVAPATTAFARIRIAMTGTPPAGNTLHVDEARLHNYGDTGGLCFDVTGVKGDVDTPLYLSIGSSAFSAITVARRMAISSRRRGTPANMPFILQAESTTLGTDATLPGNDQTASGAGSNYGRVSVWTNTALATRFTMDPFPTAAGTDVRGTYRVYGRFRGSPAAAGGAEVQLRWGVSGSTILNDTVTLDDVTSTIWDLVDLGLVQFPLGVDPGTDGMSNSDLSVRGMRIEVAVSKGSTTTNVDLDYLVFMPADDTFAVVSLQRDTSATAAVLDPDRRIAYMVGASGEVRSTTGTPLSVAGLLPSARPGVTNRYAVLLDIEGQTAGDVISDTTTLTPYYWPLYAFVRPVGS